VEKTFVINIGRQLGSGGRLIGKALADDLGIRFYDREILNLAAQESGFRKELFENTDERKSVLRSVLGMRLPAFGEGNLYGNQLSEESLFKFQSDAILKAAEGQSCLFVGRCADYILRYHARLVNIFIAADTDDRIRRICDNTGITPEEARKKIEKVDADRASYYNYYTGKRWGAAASYHLCINSSVLGLEATQAYVKEFVVKTLALEAQP
jgi:cytidylate kinase